MGKYNNKLKQANPVSRILFFLLLVFVMLTIGYSTPVDRLSASQISAMVRVNADIRITGLRVSNVSNNGEIGAAEFSVDNIMSDISLPQADSSVTFEVWVTNLGNVEMGIVDVLGLPNNLDYEFSDYTMGSVLCDEHDPTQCNLGSAAKFYFTIKYAPNGYNSGSTNFNLNFDFDFDQIQYVAQIGQQKYPSLVAAVAAVPANGQATIVLLRNTVEYVAIDSGKNIVIDFPNLVISSEGYLPVIEVLGGSFTMHNGTILTNATQGAVNVSANSTFYMDGGQIISYGPRQALYVDNGGTATITGSAFLTAPAVVESKNNRGTAQTKAGGTLNILGGTIEATGVDGIAVANAGTTIIGTKLGGISTTSPLMKGLKYGLYVEKGTVKFYDGIAKGQTLGIYGESAIMETEPGYAFYHSSEQIDGDTYETAYLAPGVTITFDPNGGSVTPTTMSVIAGQTVGTLPTPTRTDHRFDGWFTTNNVHFNKSTPVTEDIVLIAHWTLLDYVAQINANHKYTSVTSAVAAASNGATIYLIKNTSEQVNIGSNKMVTLDLQSYTLSNNGARPVLEIQGGNVTLVGGTINTSATQGAVNVKKGGSFTMTGGTINSTGNKQALYVEDGSATISGTAYLSARAQVESTNRRGTVQTVGTSTLTILGGTIVSTGYTNDGIAVSNAGTTTIGSDDGTISTTSPVIQGYETGIYNDGTVNFYDGVIKARTTLFASIPVTINPNTSFAYGTEMINSVSYDTVTLN